MKSSFASEKNQHVWHPCHHRLDYWTEGESMEESSSLPSGQQQTTTCESAPPEASAPEYRIICVLPSLSFDVDLLKGVKGVSHYEERLLYNLILLRNPKYRVIYFSSMPIEEDIIRYYWDLIRMGQSHKNEEPLHADYEEIKHRLHMVNCSDPRSDICLSEKLLKRPRLLRRVKKLFEGQEESVCLSVYTATPCEEEVARRLGVDLLAGDVQMHEFYGTKYGCKSLFSQVGVPTSDFTPLCFSQEHLAKEIFSLIQRNHTCQKLVVKLDQGFSGEGNALLHLDPIREALQELDETNEESVSSLIAQHFSKLKYFGKPTPSVYMSKLETQGAIAELFVENEGVNPSAQAFIDLSGEVNIMSTHDQEMAGQTYLGCKFPSNASYRPLLIEYTKKIGEELSRKNVRGHFGVDFLATWIQDCQKYEIHCVEINLRQCGTTHPFVTTRLLTNSTYNVNTGQCISRNDHREKYYIASDNVCCKEMEGLLAQDIREYEWYPNSAHFRKELGTGIIFHMLGCASQYGKLGLVAIGNSEEEAKNIYNYALKHIIEYANEEV